MYIECLCRCESSIYSAPFSVVSIKSNEDIPSHWRPEVEVCLNEKCINDSARNMMVRSLVNLLFAKDTKPSRANCENLARRLILKYPFLKDDMGNGYVSNTTQSYRKGGRGEGVRILHVFHTKTKCNMHPSGCLYT